MKKTIYLYPEIKIPVVIDMEENDRLEDILDKGIDALLTQKPELSYDNLLYDLFQKEDIEFEDINPCINANSAS